MVLERQPKKFKHLVKIMLNQLIEHENITTTKTKAKMLRSKAERLLKYAKRAYDGQKGPINLLKGRVHTEKIQKKLLVDLIPRIKNIQGGFVQIKDLGVNRRGDNARMAQIFIKGNEKAEYEKRRIEEDIRRKRVPNIREFSSRILLQQRQYMEGKVKENPELTKFLQQKIEHINYRQEQLEKNVKQPPKYTLLI